MQLLDGADWLRVAKAAKLGDEDEMRATLAAVRTAAKAKFAELLRAAARQYRLAGHHDTPVDTRALLPYFNPPIDAAMLQRYEITTTEQRESHPNAAWAARERAAIDEDFDSRLMVTPSGGSSGSAPMAWIPNFQERLERAVHTYRQANPGSPRPNDLMSFLPYIEPPFDSATTERLLKAERRGGR